MCQFALHYYIYMYYALLFYWVYFKSYIINIIYLFCCYKHAFAFCFREVPWGKYQQNVCFYKKRLFSQIRQSYCLKHLTIFLCPEAKSPLLIISTPLTLSGHHLITKQGTSQCFLIILPPPSGHLLMMKNLLQEVWTFVFIIILLLFIFSGFFFFLSWGFVFVCFFSMFLLSGLKSDVPSLSVLLLYSTLSATASHVSTVASPWTSAHSLLRLELWQS